MASAATTPNLYVHAAADAGGARTHRPGPKISRWFPHLLGADQLTPRMLVANAAGYIDYVPVEDFVKLELAQPFRTFTDEELINDSVRNGKMQFAAAGSGISRDCMERPPCCASDGQAAPS
jgi:hypothetical protein